MTDGPRILICDDEERFRTNLAKMLELEGLSATAVGSGAEALEAVRRQAFDVLLLDLRMPDMSGLQTLAEIKQLAPELEVIILTGHAAVDTAMEITRLGGFDYVLKPCPLEDLLLKIDAAWERRQLRAVKT